MAERDKSIRPVQKAVERIAKQSGRQIGKRRSQKFRRSGSNHKFHE